MKSIIQPSLVCLCLIVSSTLVSAETIVPMVSQENILKVKKEIMDKLRTESGTKRCTIQFPNYPGSTSPKEMDLGRMSDIISAQNSASAATANSFLDPIVSADVAILTIGSQPGVYFSRSVEVFAFKWWQNTVTVSKRSDGSISKLEMIEKWILRDQQPEAERVNSIIRCQ